MANRRLLPYKDLDDHYAVPELAGTGSAGWFRQAQNNFSLMWNVSQIYGGQNYIGTVDFEPAWTGVTVASGNLGGYVRVGQIVYLWARAVISAIGTTGAGLTTLPVEPSRSIISMSAGHGYVNDGGTTYHPVSALISAGGIVLYYAAAATDGRVIDADPISITGTGRIALYATYRCDVPPAGYLTEQNYVIDAQRGA